MNKPPPIIINETTMSSGHLANSVVILVYVPRAAPIPNSVSDGQHLVMSH